MLKLKAHSGFHDLFLKFNMSNSYLFIINTHQNITNDSGAGTISSSGAHVHPRFFSCVVCVAQSVVFCVHVSNKGRSQ